MSLSNGTGGGGGRDPAGGSGRAVLVWVGPVGGPDGPVTVGATRYGADEVGGADRDGESIARQGGAAWLVDPEPGEPTLISVMERYAPVGVYGRMGAAGVVASAVRLGVLSATAGPTSPTANGDEMPTRDPIETRLLKAQILSEYLAAAQPHDLPVTHSMAGDRSPPPGVPVWGIPEAATAIQTADAHTSATPSLDPALHAIRFDPADRTKHRGKGTLVAVLDTGCATNHKAFGHGRTKAIDATGTNPSGRDTNGHGTWCCGAVNGEYDDPAGGTFRGVAPDAHVLSVQVLTAGGWGTDQMISRGIDLAVAAEADVISMSLGGPGRMTLSEAAIRRAREAGIVVVAAAGNDGPNGDTVGYPGKYPDCVCVTATAGEDGTTPATFSSRGPEADLAAPGVSLWGPHHAGGWWQASGTSMATPVVAGAVAACVGRILDQIPDTEPSGKLAIVAVIVTAHPLTQSPPALHMGKGVVRLSAALADLDADPVPPPPPPPPDRVVEVADGEVIRFRVRR